MRRLGPTFFGQHTGLARVGRAHLPATGAFPLNDEFVLLDSFPTPHEAHLAANALRAVHIAVKIVDESAVSALPHLELALGGVKIFVPSEDVDDAIRILRGDVDLAEHPYREPSDDDLAEVDDEDEELAAHERATDDTASRAFRSSVLGLFLCPGLLHLYSVSLLLKLPSAGMSGKAVMRARLAWLINASVFVLAVLGLLRYLS